MALVSRIRIEADGKELKGFLNLLLRQSIYAPHEFEISFRMDAFEKKNEFVMEQSHKFIGTVISILIDVKQKGDSQESSLLFKGLITSIHTKKSYTGETDQVVLSGFSPDVLLNDNPGCSSFENKSLKQIVDEVLRPYPKDILKSKTDPAKSESLLYTVQYNESRYEFLRRLSQRYGEWMFYNGTQLFFGKLPEDKINLKLGLDLTDFNFSIQLGPDKFRFLAYDPASAVTIDVSSAQTGGKDNLNQYGAFAHDKSMKEFGQTATRIYNHLSVPGNNYQKELGWAVNLMEDRQALKMAAIKGNSQNPKLVPGCKAKIKALKVGEQGVVDYGEYIVSSVVHRCDSSMNYQNDFEGIPSEAKVPDCSDPFAFPRCEIQNAVVKDNNDPDKLGRVRVNFFWQDKNSMSPWLRVVTPYAGTDSGFYFIPEVGDEVLVGFEGGDAEKPYLVGSLYNGKNKPNGALPNKDNSFKGIITKSKLKIAFDDKQKITTIETPAGNKIVLSDDQKSIVLQDQNRNKVELSSTGIVLESPKEIKISSQSTITLEGTRGVNITSPADTKVTGMNINLEANIGLTAKGKATAELSAAGNTTVKGALVMIN